MQPLWSALSFSSIKQLKCYSLYCFKRKRTLYKGEVSYLPGFYFQFFLVPKSSRDWRLDIDINSLHKSCFSPFQKTVCLFFPMSFFAIQLDLIDEFFHTLPIVKYIPFVLYSEKRSYSSEFSIQPFSLWVFTV